MRSSIAATVSFILSLLTVSQLMTTANATTILACGSGKKKKCGSNDLLLDLPPKTPEGFSVRCCSETQFNRSEKKVKYGCDVWAGSKDKNGQCFGYGTIEDAEKFCQDAGARLCTCTELVEKCAKGTGCGLNKEFVYCTV
eukprot:CAMPEP_0203638570 /NCGR_PEP_ID=MMETSP0088-20131115/4568_1 /ASSEMBLY_ACC=CAM_ASM_001087 /TAXON_ID=426623 /ORGANISM="Chaetoceros affinis, Strain CCMP159" /LENGTH=139 /DNA_ID=CAMNT_0050493237 /DNA_START=38 /DNA_END=457 /DNA_ORIENTATION=+